MAKPVQLDSLTPNEKNPRAIGKAELAKLAESIRRDPEFMRLRPIVIDEQGVILGGNQRFAACREIGMTEVPADWVCQAKDLTDEQRDRFILIDNAPQGMAGVWNWDLLAEHWDAGELGELGFDLSGMNLEGGGEGTEGQTDADAVDLSTTFSVEVRCSDESQQRVVFERLTKEGLECRLLTL